MNYDKKVSLAKLQTEYLEKSLKYIDQMLSYAEVLSESQDASLIESLLFKLDELDAKASSNYQIACDIEDVIHRKDLQH